MTRVLLTGGSSPLGEALLPRLVERHGAVKCIIRSAAAAERVRRAGGDPLLGDLTTRFDAPRADLLYHLAGIALAEEAAALALNTRVEAVVAVSSASAVVPSHPLAARISELEAVLLRSQIPTFGIRPTMIYGTARDRNMRYLFNLLRRLPAVPRLVDGGRLQPVFYKDVVDGLLEATENQMARDRFVALGGSVVTTIGGIVNVMAALLGKPKLPIPVPVRVLSAGVRLAGARGRFSHAVEMLGTDRVVPLPAECGWRFASTELAEGISRAVDVYRGDV